MSTPGLSAGMAERNLTRLLSGRNLPLAAFTGKRVSLYHTSYIDASSSVPSGRTSQQATVSWWTLSGPHERDKGLGSARSYTQAAPHTRCPASRRQPYAASSSRPMTTSCCCVIQREEGTCTLVYDTLSMFRYTVTID